jgi:hypothetical protein
MSTLRAIGRWWTLKATGRAGLFHH